MFIILYLGWHSGYVQWIWTNCCSML